MLLPAYSKKSRCQPLLWEALASADHDSVSDEVLVRSPKPFRECLVGGVQLLGKILRSDGARNFVVPMLERRYQDRPLLLTEPELTPVSCIQLITPRDLEGNVVIGAVS